MVVGRLRDPIAAAVDDVILERRSVTRRRFLYLSIVEAVLNTLLLVGTFHTLAVAAYVTLVASCVLIGAGVRHCMTDREMEKRRCCGLLGPLAALTWLFRGRLVQLLLQPAALVQLGIWVHDHPHRNDAGGVIAGMVLLVALFSAGIVQLCLLNSLSSFAAVDQRITFAEDRSGAPFPLWCPPPPPNMEPPGRSSEAVPYGGGDGDPSLPAIALSIGAYGLSDAVLGTPLAPDGSPLRLQTSQPGLWRVSPAAASRGGDAAARGEENRTPPDREDITVVEASSEEAPPPQPSGDARPDGAQPPDAPTIAPTGRQLPPAPPLPHQVM